MIEKMKMVYVVSSVSKKDEMLDGLRDLGLLHLAEKKSPARAASERFTTLSKTAGVLLDYAPDKKSKGKEEAPILSDEQFEEMYQGVLAALDKKSALSQEMSAAGAEIERVKAWGDFAPAELKELKEAGYDLHFYRLAKNEFEMAEQDPEVKMIRLATIDKMDTVAVIGALPATIPAAEFAIPEKGISELTKEIEECQRQNAECDEILKKAAVYMMPVFRLRCSKLRTRRIILPQVRPQKAMRISYGFQDIFQRKTFQNSKKRLQQINGLGRRKM